MLNKVVIQGRLTKDPELKQTQSGIDNLLFTVAWSERYKEVEKKAFILCRAWRQTATFISTYFRKGAMIVIEGHLETEEWSDNDKPLVFVIEKAHFPASKSEGNNETRKPEPAADKDGFIAVPDGVDDDELPFN